MNAREKKDIGKIVRLLHYLACELLTDIKAMNFGDAKLKANFVYDEIEKIVKKYDPEGKFTVEAYLAVRHLFERAVSALGKA